MMDMNDDQDLKDKVLMDLIEKMEDVLGGRMAPPAPADHKEMAVQVAAPDKAHLAEGLDKAKDVLAHAPAELGADKGGSPMESKPADEEDDAARLAELLGDKDDDDDEDEESC